MLLNDAEITRLANEGMITPFLPVLVRTAEAGHRVISYGLSSFGYDLRPARTFKLFDPMYALRQSTWPGHTVVIDPKAITDDMWIDAAVHDDGNGEYIVIPAKRFALCHSVEYFKLPRFITALVTSKSTYARCGLNVTTTVGEAGWSGQYVIELYNTLDLPLKIYINEGIAQILFMRGVDSAGVSYADRNGKYQGQQGLTHAKV